MNVDKCLAVLSSTNNEWAVMVLNSSAGGNRPPLWHSANDNHVKELKRENLDLKSANRGKDYLIEQPLFLSHGTFMHTRCFTDFHGFIWHCLHSRKSA